MQKRVIDNKREKMPDSLPLKVTLKSLFILLKLYWTKKESLISWFYLFIIIVLTGGSVYIATRINSWYKDFWDTITNYDINGFTKQIGIFVIIASIHVVVTVYNSFIKSKMSIHWRRYITEVTMQKWLENDTYYKIQLADHNTDNPDQRIAEDLKLFVSDTIVLFIGLVTDLAMIVSFSIVLWTLSQSVDVTLFNGYVLHLPDGYLLYLAMAYAVLGTTITFILGKPLVRLNFRQQRYEADFRFSLIRVREASESIALYKGENEESATLKERFTHVVKNYILLINCTKRLGFLTLGYAQTAVIFPILIAAPIYFAKLITMGTIMQINSAFGRVQGALSTLVMNFSSWASWKAVVDRLAMFANCMDEAQKLETLRAKQISKTKLEVYNISIKTQDDRDLVKDISFELNIGDRLLIQGKSGCGKSTFIRSLAGIWPYTKGSISMPKKDDILFLSQKPYLPQGTLRQALYYPKPIRDNDNELIEYMHALDLDHLVAKLDTDTMWSLILSLGEMQRVAFIRALLTKPKVLFLDEASSALDDDMEMIAYKLVVATLNESIIVSVGHRSTLHEMHNKLLLIKDNMAIFKDY